MARILVSDRGKPVIFGPNEKNGLGWRRLTVDEVAPSEYNEPAGYTPWFVHDFQSWPDDTYNDGFEASDVGWFYGGGVNNNFAPSELVDDATAPDGSGKAVRLTWPSGHPTGFDIGNWSLTSSPDNLQSGVGHTDLRSMYMRYWIMFGDPGDTTWFDGMGYWRSWGTVNRHVPQRVDGNGSSTFGARFRNTQTTHLGDYEYWYYDANGDRGITEVYPTELIVPGVWHRFEHLVTIVSQTECRFRCWINGTQYVDATDSTTFNNNINVDGIRQIHWNNNPSGGSNPTQDYYLRISGIYVSGDPL